MELIEHAEFQAQRFNRLSTEVDVKPWVQYQERAIESDRERERHGAGVLEHG